MTDLSSMLRQLVPLYEHMDMSIDIPGDGMFRASMPFGPAVQSHVGTIHPAFQWAAAELLGGLVALTVFPNLDDIFLVVRGVDIRFKKPARTDIVAEAHFSDDRARALRDALAAGEATFDLEMTVRDTSGNVVAEATGDYLIRPRRAAS